MPEFPPYPAEGTLDEYVSGLPKFQEKSVLGHIRDRISQGQQVSVLDIGCGKGIALCQLIQKFPSIKASGLSLHDYRDVLDDPFLTYIKRVDYRVGDAHDIGEIFKGSQFDFIVSWYAFHTFPQPLSVLEQTRILLKENGLAFIDDALSASEEELYTLSLLWQKQGTEIHYQNQSPNSYRNLVLRRRAPNSLQS